jgi:hypothetical protein
VNRVDEDSCVLLIGQSNLGSGPTGLTSTGAILSSPASGGVPGISQVIGVSSTAPNNVVGDGIVVSANDSSFARAVSGTASTGVGVYGRSSNGYGVQVDARLGFLPFSAAAPTSGQFATGDVVKDSSGNLWASVATGAPQFRKLSGPGTAGQLHFLAAPSRDVNTFNSSVFATNESRTFLLPSVEDGSTGVLISLTAYSPAAFSYPSSSSGYLSVVAGGLAAGSPSMTWQSGMMYTTSLIIARVNSNREITIGCFASGAHVTADVTGYFR